MSSFNHYKYTLTYTASYNTAGVPIVKYSKSSTSMQSGEPKWISISGTTGWTFKDIGLYCITFFHDMNGRVKIESDSNDVMIFTGAPMTKSSVDTYGNSSYTKSYLIMIYDAIQSLGPGEPKSCTLSLKNAGSNYPVATINVYIIKLI